MTALPPKIRRGQPASRKLLWWLFGLLGCAAAGAILYFFDPAQHGFYPTCPFHQITGLDCPGCGSLRAIHQLTHGHLAAALHLNALLIVSMPFLGLVLIRNLPRISANQPPVRLRPIYLWLWLGLFVAFGILRNVPLSPFAQFAP